MKFTNLLEKNSLLKELYLYLFLLLILINQYIYFLGNGGRTEKYIWT